MSVDTGESVKATFTPTDTESYVKQVRVESGWVAHIFGTGEHATKNALILLSFMVIGALVYLICTRVSDGEKAIQYVITLAAGLAGYVAGRKVD